MPGPFFVVPCDQQEENPVYQGERGGEAMEDREILELFRQRDQGGHPGAGGAVRAAAAGRWPGGCWGARRTLRSASATRTGCPERYPAGGASIPLRVPAAICRNRAPQCAEPEKAQKRRGRGGGPDGRAGAVYPGCPAGPGRDRTGDWGRR